MNPSVLIRANRKKLCRISTSNAEFGTAKFGHADFSRKDPSRVSDHGWREPWLIGLRLGSGLFCEQSLHRLLQAGDRERLEQNVRLCGA